MKNVNAGLLPKIHLWADITLLNISVLIAFHFQPDNWSGIFTDQFINLLLVANLAWVLTIYYFKPYSFTRLSYTFGNQLVSLLKSVGIHGGIILTYLYLTQQEETYSRYQFAATYSLFLIMPAVFRITTVLFLQFYRQAGHDSYRYAIIGKGKLAGLIHDFYNDRKELGYRFHGSFEINNLENRIDSLEEIVEENKLDCIYCCLSEMSNEQIRNVIEMGERQKTQVRLVPDFKGFMNNKATIEYHGIFPIIQVNTKPFSSVKEQNTRRVADLALASAAMLLGLPLFGLIWALIKLTASGPALFTQTRCGRWGETFEIYKFQSMRVGADTTAIQNSNGMSNSRMTVVGMFLKKSGLDRLPQFINVLKGEMSVFGPQALYEHDVYMLTKTTPNDFPRLWSVKPGVFSTGKVKEEYANAEAKSTARLNYDLQYSGT
ncbi:sugar transferase [Dyadobacter sp. NIV53]|uniref:sugar transferase n=1 Tax=Dyadobacter sp. NIV53 TaxID=2861765 RepID=UPI001C88CE5F|nr:sugar transferase [Dyadobacter sp. NIV53]